MIPYIDGKSLKKIDERAESEYGIKLIQLMEVAGARMAEFLRSKFPSIQRKEVLVICGKGNNGGDGLVCARVLSNWGVPVKIFLAYQQDDYKGIIRQNFRSTQQLGIELVPILEGEKPDIIVDCIFGFGFKGKLIKEHEKTIDWINSSKAKVFSCDLPSGMNSKSFSSVQKTVQASCTLTFTLPKEVYKNHYARKRAGEIYVLDIGIPRPLYEEMGVNENIFQESSWIRW